MKRARMGPACSSTGRQCTWNGVTTGTLTWPSRTWNAPSRLTPVWLRPGSTAGNALLFRGDAGDEELAIADYTRAIELSPDSALGYYNRALVYSATEDWALSNADLRAAQEREPRNPEINNTVCWQLGVQRRPDAALPYCDLALEDDPEGPTRDSRGLVHGVAGRTVEAIEDFRVFLDWVEASVKPTCSANYRPSREAWIKTLQSGDSPFDDDTLRELRVRPAAPGGAPC